MSKRSQIAVVNIDGKEITAQNSRGEVVKLSRQQRIIFSKYKNMNFEDMLEDEFGTLDNLPKDFKIVKDNEVVYKRH